jgi:hypothetical protein
MLQARCRDREFQRFLMRAQCLEPENQSSAERVSRANTVYDIRDFVVSAQMKFLAVVQAR